MPTILNPNESDYRKDPNALDPFDLLTISPRLWKTAGSKHFVFDLRKLEPGKYSFPYHFHRVAEELMMVLSGSMTVRMPDNFEIVNTGQILFFEPGETGAHQFYNHGSVPCTYLDIRTYIGFDVAEYPDSDKILIAPSFEIFSKDSQVDYFEGEKDILEKWDRIKNK